MLWPAKADMAWHWAQGVPMGPPTKSVAVMEQIRELKKHGLSSYAINKTWHVALTHSSLRIILLSEY
jgi:hypothetical protein